MSKLSDFGAGVHDLDPEEEVKLYLSEWIRGDAVNVFWEQANTHGFDTFSTETTERPDLLIVGDDISLAVEVKTPDGGGEVYDGAEQTVRYWKRYCFGDDYYRARGQSVKPDAFVLASGFSPDGRLFERYGCRDLPRTRKVGERMPYLNAPIQFLPDWEFYTTEAITRMMWRFSTAAFDKRAEDVDAGVGSLLSARLDGERPQRKGQDDIGPFEGESHNPRTLFKTFGESSGVAAHNWRAIA